MNDFVENEINRIANDPSQYIDWSIPWNMTYSYNLSYSKAATGTKMLLKPSIYPGISACRINGR